MCCKTSNTNGVFCCVDECPADLSAKDAKDICENVPKRPPGNETDTGKGPGKEEEDKTHSKASKDVEPLERHVADRIVDIQEYDEHHIQTKRPPEKKKVPDLFEESIGSNESDQSEESNTSHEDTFDREERHFANRIVDVQQRSEHHLRARIEGGDRSEGTPDEDYNNPLDDNREADNYSTNLADGNGRHVADRIAEEKDYSSHHIRTRIAAN